MRPLSRFVCRSLAVVLLAGGAVAGCGDDDGGDLPENAAGGYLTLGEVGSELERGEVALVRSGGVPEPDLSVPVVDAATYEENGGREFDVIVLRTAAEASTAFRRIVDVDAGESGIRAANVVAAFPRDFTEVPTLRAVADGMRRLRVACTTPRNAEPRLRDLCLSGADEGG